MTLFRFAILAIAALAAVLAQDTQSTDPKQRAKAAREAIKAGSQGITRIRPLLDDVDLTVRTEAVKAIVEIGSQHSLEPLLKAAQDPDPELRIRATDGLVNFYLPGYVKSGISASLARAGNLIRVRFGGDATDEVIDPWIEVRPEIIAGLGKMVSEGTSVEVRANAARALGILRGRAALDVLHEALRSKDTRLMYEALIAIQKIRDPRSGPRVAFLFRDPEENVAAAALETAGLVRSAETLGEIEAAVARTTSLRVRRAAIAAMAAIADARSKPYFDQALGDKDENIRAAGAEGLARLPDKSSIPVLEQCAAGEKKMPPKLACSFGLVYQGKVDSGEGSPLRLLLTALNTRAWRGVAEGYLIELAREKTVRSAIEKSIGVASKNEKMNLARILGSSGDTDTVSILEQLTRDPEPEVMQEGVRALRNLKARIP